jgi:hypothetical protein
MRPYLEKNPSQKRADGVVQDTGKKMNKHVKLICKIYKLYASTL